MIGRTSRRRMRAISALATLALAVAMLSPLAYGEGIEEKAQICAVCHGENGVPPEQSAAPVIWGQNFGYLFFQLRDFKSGARKSDQMTPIVESLEAGELMQLAQFFSRKKWPDLRQLDPAEEVVAVAQRANATIVCAACHQRDFTGDSNQPRLAGQTRVYLEKTMIDFRTSARANNPGMRDLMLGITEKEIAALAAFLAGF
jgi:cytochrome c553